MDRVVSERDLVGTRKLFLRDTTLILWFSHRRSPQSVVKHRLYMAIVQTHSYDP